MSYHVEAWNARSNGWQELLDVCKEAAKNVPYLNVEPNVEVFKAWMTNLSVSDLRQMCMFVLYHDKTTPVGLLIGSAVNNHPAMVDQQISSELIWYVTPKHRGNQSMLLVDAYEAWAKMVGCKHATVTRFADALGERLHDVYLSRGYKPAEYTYIREL